MPIEYQVVPVDLSNGVDTKSDSKQVVAGKFLRVENGVFTKPGQIAKRNGYTAAGTTIASVGTLSAPKMVHGYGNELLAADQGLLLSYSSNQDAWNSKGSYQSVELQRAVLSENPDVSGACDVAILGNYALYGWSTTPDAGSGFPTVNGFVYGQIVDLSTGDILLNQKLSTNGASYNNPVRCVLLGSTVLAIIYVNSATSALVGRTVTFSGGGVVSFSGESTLTTNLQIPASTSISYDVANTTTGAALVYQSTTGVTTATLSTALAVSSTNRAVTIGLCPCISTCISSNGNIFVYWTEDTDDGSGNLTALTIYYSVYNSVLTQQLTRTSIVATAAPYYVSNMMAKADSATQQTLYYGLYKTNNNGSKHEVEFTNYCTASCTALNTGSAGTPAIFANGITPFSRAFTVGSKIYSVFLYRGADITVTGVGSNLTPQPQPTLFLLELTNLLSPPLVVARFGSGVSATFITGRIKNGYTPNVVSFSSTKFYFSCGLVTQIYTGSSGLSALFPTGLISVFSYSFDFSSADSYHAVTAGNLVLLNGGVVQNYDGSSCSEWNFHLFPEITNLTQGVAGSIADGAYSYLAIFQWIDAQGNLHQSQPSQPKAITVSAGSGTAKVTITVTSTFLTRKQNCYVTIFRTQASSTIYYQVSNPIYVLYSDPSTGAVLTFDDTNVDSAITANSQPYTSPSSSVLENGAPQPSMIMVAHNNRVFFRDDENRSTYFYSKSYAPGNGISPSASLLEQLDPKYGDISALSEMDEKLVVFKSNGLFLQSGDGADDTGQGSSLSFPQIVPSDVGCNSFKSAILTPEGVIFKSPNGIYILGRAGNTAYLGAEVEQYNSQDITGSTSVPGKSQIRFLTSSGSTLVYDYIFKKWATFTGHTGTSSTTWNSTYVYANNSANKIYKESSTSYLDDATAYSLLLQTSWLRISSIQGFQRVRRLIMLGDYVNGNSELHNLSISAAYDFSTTFQTAVTYAFGTTSSSGVFQYRERLSQQKCDTISLLIQETTTGSSLETIDLTNISFEAGIKRGVNKLSGTKSVG